MPRQPRRSLQAVLLAALAGVPSLAHAQVSGSWVNPGSGTWTVGANWDSNPLYPDGGGTASFTPIFGGAGTVTLNAGVTLSAFRFDSTSTLSIAGTGSITLSGNSTIFLDQTESVQVTHKILVPFYSATGIVAEGPGRIDLRSANYTGPTVVNGGLVRLPNVATFGGGSSTITLNGGSIEFNNFTYSVNVLSPIEVSAMGGSLEAGSSTKPVVLTSPIGGSGTLTFGYSSGPHRGTPGAYSVRAASTLTGVVQQYSALLTLESNGAFGSVSAIDNRGTLKIVNDSTSGVLDRIGDTVPILHSAGFILTSTAGATPAVEHVGTIIANGVISATATAQLATPQLVRAEHRTFILGTDAVSSGPFVQITGSLPELKGTGLAGTPQVPVLPWAETWDDLPVTIDATGHLRPLDSSEYLTAIPNGAAGSNVRLAAGATVTAPASVNSLTLLDGTIGGSGTILISGGQLIFGSANYPKPTINTPIDFGSSEGIVTGGSGTLSGAVSGSGGLTIATTVYLSGPSTYTGVSNVSGGAQMLADVLPGVPGPLGTDSSPVVVSGHLSFPTDKSGPILFARDIRLVDGGDIDAYGTATVTFAGNIEVDEEHHCVFGVADFEGTLSGLGTLNLGIGTVFMSANNSGFLGTIDSSASFLGAAADNCFGNGTLVMWSGELTAVGGPRVLNNALVMRNTFPLTVPIISGNFPLTVTGPVDLFNVSQTLSITNTATTTFSNTVSNGRLVKTGSGLLEVGGVQLRSLTVSQGPIRVLPGGSVPSKTNSLAITAGASLDLTDNAIVIDYTGASPQSGIRAMLIDGRLNSSLADATHALGYGESSDLGISSFEGVAVDPTSVLIDFTYRGDANLDEQVNIVDLYALASNWNSTSADWTMGDFNYDGLVNTADLTCLAINWQAGVAAPTATPLSETLISLGLPQVQVPEPVCMGEVLGAVAVLSRRARRRSINRPPDGAIR